MEQSPRVEKCHGIAIKTLLTMKQVTSNKDLLSVVIDKWMNFLVLLASYPELKSEDAMG